jgi:hypothetical protein
MIRRGIVIVAILAALLSTHAVGLAYDERTAQLEETESVVMVLSSSSEDGENTALDFAIVEDEPVAAKPGVSVWGKCQVPGKCEIGISIKVRF